MEIRNIFTWYTHLLLVLRENAGFIVVYSIDIVYAFASQHDFNYVYIFLEVRETKNGTIQMRIRLR